MSTPREIRPYYLQSRDSEIITALPERGYTVYQLSDAVDYKSFFSSGARVFPLDPPIGELTSWDAFSDSLWYGLNNSGHRRIAICWTDAGVMLQNDPAQFDVATQCLADVADQLHSDPESHVERLIILLFGDGPAFNDVPSDVT